MRKEVKIVVLEALGAVKANPDMLDVMDLSDEYFQSIIDEVEKEPET